MSIINPLDEIFAAAGRESRAVLMPYLTAGFPHPDDLVDLAVAILDAGADALEIGIPFSDPLLDGPTIQRSQQAALEAGTTPLDCLRYAAEIRARTAKPVLLMGAYNPLLAQGLNEFCRQAGQAGVTGLIVPDLPLEEQHELRAAAAQHDLHVIQMAAPTSTDERLDRVCAQASGFVYCISVAGLTGARAAVPETARPLVERVRARTDVPVVVGFGIANAEGARAVAQFADGVIVASALLDVLTDGDRAGGQARAVGFVTELVGAVRDRTSSA